MYADVHTGTYKQSKSAQLYCSTIIKITLYIIMKVAGLKQLINMELVKNYNALKFFNQNAYFIRILLKYTSFFNP